MNHLGLCHTKQASPKVVFEAPISEILAVPSRPLKYWDLMRGGHEAESIPKSSRLAKQPQGFPPLSTKIPYHLGHLLLRESCKGKQQVTQSTATLVVSLANGFGNAQTE